MTGDQMLRKHLGVQTFQFVIDSCKKKRALRLDWVYKTFFGWLSIPFASIALTLTVIYVIVVFNAIKQRRVSRKCYILLLNRAIGDVLACITCLIGAGYVLLTEKANRDVVSIMDTFFIASFWSAMVSYVSLSVLKLYAVAKPFNYRRAVTMKRCIHLMIFSWVVFLFMVAYALTVTALVKIPVLNEWSGCKMETCLRRMYQSRNLLTVIVYFLTIISFFITGKRGIVVECEEAEG
uniref:G_PROTEIN_RECEP_F1_2 domain-containing protein n=1 Tax=Steinernema glaseri TaxID=37863 RepID=A0A1I8AG84_9BILA